jgi:hypothetical protein
LGDVLVGTVRPTPNGPVVADAKEQHAAVSRDRQAGVRVAKEAAEKENDSWTQLALIG